MFLIFGSVFIIAAGFAAYLISCKNLCHNVAAVLYELKFYTMGIKPLIDDLLEVKRNTIELPNKSGRVAIVTGGSRGMGSEIVKMLLQCDMEVILACRTPAAGDKLIRLLRESGVTKGSAKVYELDNNSLESVRRFAETVKRDYTKIHVLVNNAAVAIVPYSESKEGFGPQWGINYLSHFLLTALLLPLLKEAGTAKESARIVNVSSRAHVIGEINFEDVNNKKSYYHFHCYAQSKLAQLMFTKSVQERLAKESIRVQAYAVHPGIVNTDIYNGTLLKKYCKWFMDMFFKTPVKGATSIVYAAVSSEVEGRGGIYISNCHAISPSRGAENQQIRERLFNLALKQAGLKDFM